MAYKIIKNLSHEQWLEERAKGIGSSEVGTLLGLNPYESPYQLWERKTGRMPGKEETFAMKAGHYLESAVASFFEDETGNKVIKSSAGDWLAVDNERPYLRVSPDRLFWIKGMPKNKNNKGIVECKTTQRDIDPEDPPLMWKAQLTYQLGVMGLKVGYLAWLTAGRKFGYCEVRFDQEVFDDYIVRAIDEFYNINVKGDKEPERTQVVDFPTSSDGTATEASADTLEAYYKLRNINGHIKDLSAEKKELEDQIKVAMGDCETLLSHGDKLATWKSPKPTAKFDVDTFAVEHPELHEQYLRESQGARRFLLR